MRYFFLLGFFGLILTSIHAQKIKGEQIQFYYFGYPTMPLDVPHRNYTFLLSEELETTKGRMVRKSAPGIGEGKTRAVLADFEGFSKVESSSENCFRMVVDAGLIQVEGKKLVQEPSHATNPTGTTYEITLSMAYSFQFIAPGGEVLYENKINNSKFHTVRFPQDASSVTKTSGYPNIAELENGWAMHRVNFLGLIHDNILSSRAASDVRQVEIRYSKRKELFSFEFFYVKDRKKDRFPQLDSAIHYMKTAADSVGLNVKNKVDLNWRTQNIRQLTQKAISIWTASLSSIPQWKTEAILQEEEALKLENGLRINIIQARLFLDEFDASLQEIADIQVKAKNLGAYPSPLSEEWVNGIYHFLKREQLRYQLHKEKYKW